MTSDSGNTVTLSLANFFGHGTRALTCTGNATLKATVTAGYTTFSGCSISAGGNYEIHAADDAGGIAATSGQEFTVTGVPAQLAFSTQPGTCGGFGPCTAATGSPFNPQPVVAVEDANGNVVTTDAGDKVTLTLDNTLPGHGTRWLNCTGTTTATVASGYTTFTGCSIATTGNYQLTATDSVHTIAAVNSNRLTVKGASQLAFTAQPSRDVNEVMGVPFTTQPVVAQEDANGDVVTSDSGNTVTLSLANFFGHGTGALTCTGNATLKATVTAATDIQRLFHQCRRQLQIHAADSAGGIAATTGQEFGVAGAPTQLAFTTQPVGGAPGQAFTQNPAVSIEDANGNVETTDSSTMVALTLSAGGAISCIANPTQAQQGVVTFTGCSLNNAGFYTLTATDVTNGHITATQTFLIIF